MRRIIRTASEVLSGNGNPFFGKKHPDHIKKLCKEIGSVAGRKFLSGADLSREETPGR